MIEVPVRVKDALRDGRRLKNYIFKVLNDDNSVDFVIDNDTLVKESVKIDERMCTGNQLKFGLCEGSSLEFQYFDHPNITGRQIQAFIEVQFVDENGDLDWYEIPMGFFTVDQCPMQFSTGIRKVTAYNKLKSAYLDQKANLILEEMFPGSTSELFFNIRHALLDEYEINTYTQKPWGKCEFIAEDTGGDFSTHINSPRYFPDTLTGKTTLIISCKYEIDLDPDKFYKFVWTKGDVDAYETGIYDLIVSAMRTDGVTDTDITNAIANLLGTYNTYLGCYTLFGVVLKDENNQETIYSKKAYDNNKYGAVGPVSDLTKNYFHGYSKITLYMPLLYGLSRLYGAVNNRRGFYCYDMDGTGEKVIRYYSGSLGYGDYSSVWGTLRAQIDENNNHGWEFTSIGILPPSQSDVLSIYGFSDGIGFYDNYAAYRPSFYTPSALSYVNYVDFKFSNGESTSKWQDGEERVHGGAFPVDVNEVFMVKETEALNSADYITVNPNDMADITARDAVSSVYELSACYGKLDRNVDYFAPVELNNSRLLPADTLYPANDLYPVGDSLRSDASMYQKLWTDSQGVQTFRYLIITYKGLDDNNQEVEKIMQRTVNADGTTDYNMSDNWLFKNLVWTDEDVGDYADAMVLKMQNVSWFPFEMWCAGLPYIETGDELEISNSEGTYTSYVLQRQLNGIQNLQDTYINGELDIF